MTDWTGKGSTATANQVSAAGTTVLHVTFSDNLNTTQDLTGAKLYVRRFNASTNKYEGYFTLTEGSATKIEVDTADNKKLDITLGDNKLEAGKKYIIEWKAGSLKDAAGNDVATNAPITIYTTD